MLRKSTLAKKQHRAALLFLMPHFIGFFVFVILSIAATFVISFYDWNMINPAKFVGADNYVKLFTNDSIAVKTGINTLVYTFFTVIFIVAFSLLAALGLSKDIKGTVFFRTVYFLPAVASLVAVSLVWLFIYNTDHGLLNHVLRFIGIVHPPAWLSSSKWSLSAVIIMSVWGQIGFFMIIFIAGLKNIPRELYEAARIDGANSWQSFWRITLPLLSPTTFFVVIMCIINSFQVFEQAFIMTQGGPNFSTTTAVLYIYNTGFKFHKMGYASSIGWVLFLCIFVVTLIQMRLQKKWVHY
ncbi:MAG: sugar ABC transporter permease [Clostridia bacterium BRH_c25]|nr:MAG: sugar ABC transporter permease [Clostridia bacterium BRH_c25]